MNKSLKSKIKEFQRFSYIMMFVIASCGIAGSMELERPVTKGAIIFYVISLILTILTIRYENKNLNRG